MLLLSRCHLCLQVYYADVQVQITPQLQEHESNSLLHTFARGEQLLAQMYLTTKKVWTPQAQLKVHFHNRGWLMQEIKSTTSSSL